MSDIPSSVTINNENIKGRCVMQYRVGKPIRVAMTAISNLIYEL